MDSNKKSAKQIILNIILIIVILIMLCLLIYIGVNYYNGYKLKKDALDFANDFNLNIDNDNEMSQLEGRNYNFKGYNALGVMEIPKINFLYPVLDTVTPDAINRSVGVLYPNIDKLNEPGNVVIIGHNYKNGLLFSNIKYLENGDKIYITDKTGLKVEYTVYDKFITNYQDTSFYDRETEDKPEITLSTCTDENDERRLIILAK